MNQLSFDGMKAGGMNRGIRKWLGLNDLMI